MADQLRRAGGVHYVARDYIIQGWRDAAYYGHCVGIYRYRSTGLVDTKIKTTKINSDGFLRLFTKFSTPENYPLYGTMATVFLMGVHLYI